MTLTTETPLRATIAAFEAKRSQFLTRVGQAQALEQSVNRLTEEVAAQKALAETYEMTAALFTSYSEAEHDELRQRIESLVTFGLQCVFGDELSFRVKPGTKAGQAILEFAVVSMIEGEEVETDVMEARGGGLAAIIGFVLRVVVLSLGPDTSRRFLLLDETFGMVSAEYQEPLSSLLRQLVDQTGLQILLVTHAPKVGLEADLVYRFDHDGSRTVLQKMDPAEL